MRKFLLAMLAVMFLISCGETENKTATDSSKKDTVINSTNIINDTNVINNPLLLSAAEMKDDSVFTDGSIPTSWENAGIKDVKGLKLFLKQVQQWVMSNEKEKLATTIKYPLKEIKNEQELVTSYDRIFTKEVKLSFATINFSQIFRNQQGVMINNGKVWINQFGNEFKIFAINQ